MKHPKRCLAAIVAVLSLLSICFAEVDETPEKFCCPYTSIWWEAKLEDVLALEGKGYETYNSVYGGLTYVFSREYKGASGQIKYMFDAEGNLSSLAWMYTDGDLDAVLATYAEIYAELEAQLGETGYANANQTNAGGVWYTPEADILINVVTMQESAALQYTYINPNSSRRPDGTQEQ